MVHLLQISVILSAVVLVVGGLILYAQYYNNTSTNVREVIEIIGNNQTGLSSIGGGNNTGSENQTAPTFSNESSTIGNITLPGNVQILQNEINNTRYTAILITENLSQS